jgi:hypothetical protein
MGFTDNSRDLGRIDQKTINYIGMLGANKVSNSIFSGNWRNGR